MEILPHLCYDNSGDNVKAVGIICEYNPFHNGHLYHINKIKEMYNGYKIIVVMSGNFTQRGDVSILDKWDKTELALQYGCDLVVELPFVFASQSADMFAHAAIYLLSELQVDVLVFGSESNNIELLKNLAKIQLEDKRYNKLVSTYIEEGISYPTATSKALFTLTGKRIDKSNDILGLSYIREIYKQESEIEPICIKRNNDFASRELSGNETSATSIRHALLHGEDVSNYVPPKTNQKLTKKLYFNEEYFPILKYKILTDCFLDKYQTVEEGIENRLRKYMLTSKSMEEFILKIKAKRYTYNRINRMLTHILVGFTKEEAKRFKSPEYIRILGFTYNGQKYLNEIKNELSLPIVSKFTSIKHHGLQIELKATIAYASILEEEEKIRVIEAEYKNSPIMY